MKREMRLIDECMKEHPEVQTESQKLWSHEISVMKESDLRLLLRLREDDLTKEEAEKIQAIFDDLEAKGIKKSDALR